jgi:hypothetical protein
MRARLLAACAAGVVVAGGFALAPGAQAINTPSFGPSALLRCEVVTGSNCGQNVEAEVKVDGDGNAYASAIAGVPGGVNLWKRSSGETTFPFVGMPDALPAGVTPATGVAAGGGDIAVAVAPERNGNGKFNVYLSSLSLASTTVATSRDGGETFSDNYASTAPIAVVDRQWLAAEGPETLYQIYRDESHVVWIQKSTDGGATFGLPAPVVTDPMAALIATNPATSGSRFSNVWRDPVSGNLMIAVVNRADIAESFYAGHQPPVADPTGQLPPAAAAHRIWLNVCTPSLSCTTHDVYTEPDPQTRVDADFPWVTTDAAGRVYVSYTTTQGVFLAHSTDGGSTFGSPVRADTPSSQWRTVFPAIVAGDAGRVGVAFFGAATDSLDDATAAWNMYYAMSVDGGDSFTQVKASDEPAHVGSICLRGLDCDLPSPVGHPGNRDLAEVVTITLDTDGMPIIAYPATQRHSQATGTGVSVIVKQAAGERLVTSSAPVSAIDEIVPAEVTFGSLAPATLHLDGSVPVGEVERVNAFASGNQGPVLTTDAPAGPVKLQHTTRNGNPGVAPNPLLAFFSYRGALKLDDASPSADVWMVAPDGVAGPINVNVELFVDGVPRYGQSTPTGGWDPISFPVTLGPTPTLVHFALPAITATATEGVTLQFGVETAASSEQHLVELLYGDPGFDSSFGITAAFPV